MDHTVVQTLGVTCESLLFHLLLLLVLDDFLAFPYSPVDESQTYIADRKTCHLTSVQ